MLESPIQVFSPRNKKNKYAAGVIFVNRCNLLPAAQLATSIGDFCDPFGWTCPWLTVGHTKGNMKRNPPWFWGIKQCVAYNEFEWFPGKTSALLGFGVISWRLTLESIYTVGEFAVLVPECQWAVGGDLRVGSQLKSGAKRQCWRTTRIIIQMYKYIYVHIYICTHIYIYVHIYIYICTHIYIYLYMYIYLYIYICTHIFIYVYTSSLQLTGKTRQIQKKPAKSTRKFMENPSQIFAMKCAQEIIQILLKSSMKFISHISNLKDLVLSQKQQQQLLPNEEMFNQRTSVLGCKV